jgi:hypothetical protein
MDRVKLGIGVASAVRCRAVKSVYLPDLSTLFSKD